MSLALSVLDLASVREGGTIREAFENSVKLAQAAERLGYFRFWMAEHHNLTGIASSATAVILGHVAEHTKSIRIGSGGVMLPNHAPLVIAEQFGTLESLYPGRIDLGLGRAPGTDRTTMRALRRDHSNLGENFDEMVRELQYYLASPEEGQKLQAIPGAGLDIPIWILGSSLYSAQLAAAFGLPYAFAGHFAPDLMLQAVALYRAQFKPSTSLQEPRVMICVQAVAADTNEQAEFLATTLYQRFLGIIRNKRQNSPAPVDNMDLIWGPEEKAAVMHTFRYAVIGDRQRVSQGLHRLIDLTRPDEIMICAEMYGIQERIRSLEIIKSVASEL
jgi:luciferase family oxidoreductase group 1